MISLSLSQWQNTVHEIIPKGENSPHKYLYIHENSKKIAIFSEREFKKHIQNNECQCNGKPVYRKLHFYEIFSYSYEFFQQQCTKNQIHYRYNTASELKITELIQSKLQSTDKIFSKIKYSYVNYSKIHRELTLLTKNLNEIIQHIFSKQKKFSYWNELKKKFFDDFFFYNVTLQQWQTQLEETPSIKEIFLEEIKTRLQVNFDIIKQLLPKTPLTINIPSLENYDSSEALGRIEVWLDNYENMIDTFNEDKNKEIHNAAAQKIRALTKACAFIISSEN